MATMESFVGVVGTGRLPANGLTAAGVQGFFYDGVAADRAVRAGLSRRWAATRPLPMEELCFFVKPIDNSRLSRVVDPHSSRECLKLVGCVSAVFVLVLLYVGPYVVSLRAGYRLAAIQKQHEALTESTRQLQVKQAKLRDPQRIYSIARGKLGLDSPEPEQVAWPDGPRSQPNDPALLARNSSRTLAAPVR